MRGSRTHGSQSLIASTSVVRPWLRKPSRSARKRRIASCSVSAAGMVHGAVLCRRVRDVRQGRPLHAASPPCELSAYAVEPRGTEHEQRLISVFCRALPRICPLRRRVSAASRSITSLAGHTDPERVPIEGLIEQRPLPVLRREGSKLGMYNLAQGPQGFIGLREMVADKLKRHRGMNVSRDEVLVTTGSGQARWRSAGCSSIRAIP